MNYPKKWRKEVHQDDHSIGERIVFLTSDVGTAGYPHVKDGSHLTLYAKNPKLIRDVNVKVKTRKLLGGNLRVNLHNFLEKITKHKSKRKIIKLYFIKIKVLCFKGYY